MLSLIRIQNLAIVESLELEFGPGLNVLTGETGAGKSIVLEAIGLLTGARAQPSIVREGADRAIVEGLFEIRNQPAAALWIAAQGFGKEDDSDLILRREVLAAGRSRALINGNLATAGQLAELGALIAEFCGQGENQKLLVGAHQRDLLDEFAALDPQRRDVGAAHRHVAEAKTRLDEFLLRDRDWKQRLDFLEFQLNELDGLALRPGELAELESEHRRLVHAERLALGVSQVRALLEDGDVEQRSALDLLGSAHAQLERMQELDPLLDSVGDDMAQSIARLEDVLRSMTTYENGLVSDPEQLRACEDRLNELNTATRKYGLNEEGMLAKLTSLREQVAELSHWDEAQEDLENEVAGHRERLLSFCRELSRRRLSGAARLAAIVQGSIRELALPEAEFDVRLVPLAEAGPAGAENVEFWFTANAGEPAKPLAAIASGGELSRILLALTSAGAECRAVPLLVFDEVDTGISGRAARKVGEALAQLAASAQVLCITHQAAIASRADHHLMVAKEKVRGRTITSVKVLDKSLRKEEIARLLDGRSTSKSLELAGEMLESTA